MMKDKFNRVQLLQDFGMLLFLMSVFTGTMIVVVSDESLRMQNLIMLVGVFLIAVLTVFRVQYTAVVVTAFQILFFAAYKLYQYYSQDQAIETAAYLWLAVVLGELAGMALFLHEFNTTEQINSVLRQQVEDLTVEDPMTGLENLRSMYANLSRTMALSARNNTEMGLMLIKLRYAQELKKIMSARNYDRLRKKMADIVQDTLRLEDRVYTVDQDGSLGIIFFCNKEGAGVIKKRLLDVLEDKNAFSGILDKPVKVEVRIGYLQYEKEMETNAILFREKTESEMQYDV
ncbi:MAG: GGDEF domain-containing protein [Butyrivibrio sp.]|jgi:GGDEF domain-containing protein|nr:GGDEF domain-containing protein [Butyrivibrio sp.]